MQILILGGTRFVGPHLVEAAQARGHEVTLFNRGRTNPEMFPELEKLRGDRNGELQALEGRRWDAVLDTSGYVPRQVRLSAELLADSVTQYLFVSTLSVYADRSVDVDEESPVGKLDDESVEQVTGATYGPLKALCEQAAEAAMPGRVTNVRPGLIVGPLDNSGRFTYWPVRVARGAEVLAPGKPHAPVQFIDARDLAEWCIRLVEDGHEGVYNAIGPFGGMTMQEFLHGCKVVTGSECRFTWVPDAFLLEQRLRAYTEVPLWIPREGPEFGVAAYERAREKGLTLRPAGDTIRDTLAWVRTLDDPWPWRAGLAAEKEQAVLEAWHGREGGG